MGGITEIATSAPGYSSVRPDDCAPLAEILKLNGYSTAQFGKCHEVPVWETSPDGAPKYCYNLLGLATYSVTGDAELTPGTHQLRMDFRYDGGGLGKGGAAVLSLDGTKIGEGRIDATAPIFTAETTDVGKDNGSPVSDDYTPENSAFTGTVNWAKLDIGDDSHDHLITPQDRIRAAVTRQ